MSDSVPAAVKVPWLKIAGLLAVVGIAAVVVNLAGKRAYDLWKTGA